MAATLSTKIDWEKVYTETINIYKSYLQINTTNPPGNEIKAAEFFKNIFDLEGIESRIYESEPGRASILARLDGTDKNPPVILLNHMDVVPFEAEKWDYPPFKAEEHDGFIYARGAQDMKALGTLEFMMMLLLKRHGVKLNRDVIFLGCADEERGGAKGAGYMVDTVDSLKEAAFVINEGGGIHKTSTGRLIYKVGFSEKTPSWFRVTSTGVPGHGSVPTRNHCNIALVKAIDRLANWETEIDLIPIVIEYCHKVAETEEEPVASILADIENAVKDPEKLNIIVNDYPHYNALIRDTLAPNIIKSGSKINVMPSEGWCEFDTRILPGHTREGFLEKAKEVVKGLPVELELRDAKRPIAPGIIESTESDFYRAVEKVAEEMTPGAVVTPSVMTGASDSQYFRVVGVPSYGFAPLIATTGEKKRVHGHNERMSLDNMRFGVKALFRIMEMVAV